MTDNWRCPKCTAYNPPRKSICWQCGYSRVRAKQSTHMPRSGSAPVQHRFFSLADLEFPKWTYLAIPMAVLVLGCLSLVLAQYWLDRRDYSQGKQLYLQADCDRALTFLDRLAQRWRLVNVGQYVARSEGPRQECSAFQSAVWYQQGKNWGAALIAYDELANTYPTSPLVQAAQIQAKMLSTEVSPDRFATSASCARIDSLLEHNLVPQPNTQLPPFYLACGRVADTANDPSTAYGMYERLLVGFPSHALARDAAVSLLMNPLSCERVNSLQNTAEIADRANFLPTLYVHCGQSYEAQGRYEEAFTMYATLLTDHPDHPLVGAAISALPTYRISCERAESLQSNLSAAQQGEIMPLLYSNCGQTYEAEGRHQEAFEMYKALLTQHGAHPLADAAAAALLASETACHNVISLQNNEAIAGRPDFLPRLYSNCGSIYGAKKDYAGAIRMYNRFLAEYPEHGLASQVEASLARSIVENLRTEEAGTLPAPQPTGWGQAGLATVVIQNDSPERVRLAFSGPDGRVEELEPCPSCTTFSLIEPSSCPAKGSIGRYTLKPGQYDITMESLSDPMIAPIKGTWSLSTGRTYNYCFYVVTTLK